jgi:hypothetical protein
MKINMKARIQFFLLVTDYVKNDPDFTIEEKELVALFRVECKNWNKDLPLPLFPECMPYPDLYDQMFKR